MKTLQVTRKSNRQAFTLIEMIGVLAVIAILAAVLIPKVFSAINNARVNNAAMSVQTVKTAAVDHYSKYGGILANGTGTNYTVGVGGYDTNLLAEGFLEKPFIVRIGDGIGTTVETINISSFTSTVGPDDTTGFALDGSSSNNVTGSVMVVAKITGVDANDAKDLNDRVDGTSLGTTVPGADLMGRVKYAAVTSNTTVYVYITHR